MRQNARVAAFTVSELLWEKKRGRMGRIHNMSEKHRVTKAVSLSVAQSCSQASQMNDKKRIRGGKRNFTTNEPPNKNHSRILKLSTLQIKRIRGEKRNFTTNELPNKNHSRILKLSMNKHFYNNTNQVSSTMELSCSELYIVLA